MVLERSEDKVSHQYAIYVCENHDSQDLGIYKALSLCLISFTVHSLSLDLKSL